MSAPAAVRPACFDDPVKLQHAARLVRASLARQGLTLADLVPPDFQTSTAAEKSVAARARRARTSTTPSTERRAAA